jgi:Peptidase A4 family
MPHHQAGADADCMLNRNYATALSAAVLLAAAVTLTACDSGQGAHSPARTAASPAQVRAASTIPVTEQEDSNWAGYLVKSGTAAKTTFSSVSGSWIQPAVDCGAGFPSHSVFWVGLGGYTGEHLEQTGTSADCSAGGQAVYSAWYELVPAAQVTVNMTVQPGDRLSARVAVSGDAVTISIADSTRHTTFTKRLTMSSPTVSSAEWIAEAPSQCVATTQRGSSASSSSQDCHILSLADFGSVTFTGASVSASGRTGAITSGLGAVSALTLEASPGFGRLYGTAAQADASPGALSAQGSSFTVNWQRPEIPIPAPAVIVIGPIYN